MIITTVVLGGVLYAGLVLLLYLIQDRLIYRPVATVSITPSARGYAYQPITTTTADGLTLAAWYLPPPPNRPVVLFCHGNGGNLGYQLGAIEFFLALELGVLLFDYRGYGESQGRPSEEGTYRDSAAAWRQLVELGHQPRDIIIYGHSLGGANAAWLAGDVAANTPHQPPRALILDSTFTSLPAMAAYRYPWLPTRWLTRYRYDNKAALVRVKSPVLIIHGTLDGVVPYEMGQRLYEVAPEPKALVSFPGGHYDGFYLEPDDLLHHVQRFLTTHSP